jgi:hypothetical protein
MNQSSHRLSRDESLFLLALAESYVFGTDVATLLRSVGVDTGAISMSVFERLRTPAKDVDTVRAAERVGIWTPIIADATVYDVDMSTNTDMAQTFGRIHVCEGGARLALEQNDETFFIDLPDNVRLCEGDAAAATLARKEGRLERMRNHLSIVERNEIAAAERGDEMHADEAEGFYEGDDDATE